MNSATEFPDHLPLLPPIPPGFDRWIYRGVKYASPRAIMVTSIDETDDDWDPVHMFQTRGDDNTHYAEAVIDHHWICKCDECVANRAEDAGTSSTSH